MTAVSNLTSRGFRTGVAFDYAWQIAFAVALLVGSAFVLEPLRPPAAIPTTLQLALVPLLAASLGSGRAYAALMIYLLLALSGVPVFSYIRDLDQTRVFVFWWPGAMFGYLLASFAGDAVYRSGANASFWRLLKLMLIADAAMIIPHFLWQISRVNLGGVFVLVQMVVALPMQCLVLFALYRWIWRAPRSKPEKPSADRDASGLYR